MIGEKIPVCVADSTNWNEAKARERRSSSHGISDSASSFCFPRARSVSTSGCTKHLSNLPVPVQVQKQFPIISVEQFLWQHQLELRKSNSVSPESNTVKTSEALNTTEKTLTTAESQSESDKKYFKGIFTGKELDLFFGLEEKDNKIATDSFFSVTERLQDCLATAGRNLSELVHGAGIETDRPQAKANITSFVCDNDTSSVLDLAGKGSLHHMKNDAKTSVLLGPLKDDGIVYCTPSKTPSQSTKGDGVNPNSPNDGQLQEIQDHLVTEVWFVKSCIVIASHLIYSLQIH